jgi:type VI protein secretion system component Hcp
LVDQAKTDLVMLFRLDNGPVLAECALEVAPGDPLMPDFAKNTGYDRYSNFFEVTSFSMSLRLKEEDKSANVLGTPQRTAGHDAHQPKARGTQEFARWRSASQSEYKDIVYPLEFGACNFSRVIDSASPIFFEGCCTSRTFDKAVLVKRIAVGDPDDPTSTDRPSLGYLRLEFTDVLITGVNWTDGDLVTEQCDFICRGLTVQYRQQSFPGNLGATFPAVWPHDRRLSIRTGRRF